MSTFVPASPNYPKNTVIDAKEKHTATVILLHGLGDSANGWKRIADTISVPWVKWIFPTAATQPVTLCGEFIMHGYI